MEGSKTVLLVGTLDTKGAEYAYLRERLREHGVDVLLPGQTIIAELLWREGIREVEGALVLDPRLPMLRMAEMLVDMRRAGFGVSRRGFHWQKPPAELEQAVRDFYAGPPAA